MVVIGTCTIEVGGAVDSSWSALHNVSIIELLYYDRRPTFILDMQQDPPNSDQPSPTALVNPALRENAILFNLVTQVLDGSSVHLSDHQPFLDWMHSSGGSADASEFRHSCCTWSQTTLKSQWRVFMAEIVQSHPVSASIERIPGFKPEELSKVVEDTQHEISHIEEESDRNDSRSGSRKTSTSDKLSNTSTRARNFFGTELRKSTNDQCGSTGEPSLADIWSDTRIAQRNASLLDQISAFDAVGISIANNDGEIVFASDAWYKICGLPHGPVDVTAWMNIFGEDEQLKVADVWKSIMLEQKVENFQVPLKRRWNPTADSVVNSPTVDFPVWITVWAYADVSSEGKTIGCCCLLTDISSQKWSEHLIDQQLANAVERASVMEQLSKDLRATETRFRRISDSMPHGIFMCDIEGKMFYTNEAYREIFPGASDPSKPEPWWTNVPEDELARGMEVWRRLREDHVKVSFEMSFYRFSTSPDGSTPVSERRYMTVSAYPELDNDNKIKHIAGCITDTSHLKIAEQTQVARADNAEESKRQLEHFIDMTSHEMRNPFSAILHSADDVLATLHSLPHGLMTGSVTSAISTLETIIDCINHCTRIIDDILVVSKLNSGLLSITPTAIQFVPAVEQALKIFDGEMRAADITQSLTVDESFDKLNIDWLSLDVSRVRQILVNLVTNAIKFTKPESTRQINVLLHASLERPTSKSRHEAPQYLPAQEGPAAPHLDSITSAKEIVYISISVIDSGCGIAQDVQKTLFQKFSQGGQRTHIKYGGTGLGLYISRRLCEMQGGQIGLHSTPGKGAIFTFYIEASKCDPFSVPKSKFSSVGLRFGSQQQQVSASKVTLSSALSEYKTDPDFDRTILLVEDNIVNQKIVAKMLRGQGFTVQVANHGLEALDQIRNSALLAGAFATAEPISLVLLDIEMPVMDGLTCVRNIRKMEMLGELRCHVPVVAITANARQEQIDQAKAAGMDDVVTKPFRIGQLLTVMTRLW